MSIEPSSSSWVAGRRQPWKWTAHRINSGTLSYLPRWVPAALPGLSLLSVMYPRVYRASPRLARLDSTRLGSAQLTSAHGVVHERRSNVDDGMTDRGRVRVADTGRVIGGPPGGRPPSRGHEGRLVSQTQRALSKLTERILVGRRQPLQADNALPHVRGIFVALCE